MSRLGALLCVASAAAFGAMAVFGRLAYGEGVSVGTLLSARFVLAAVALWLAVLASGGVPALRAVSARDAGLALSLGAAGYAAQAGAFFAALTRIDAGLLSLLVYTFPVMVFMAAIVSGRERADPRRLAVLALACAGLLLVLAGTGTGQLEPVGAGLGLAAAVLYSGYIIASDRMGARIPPLLLTALVCTGAAVTLTLGAMAAGELRPGEVTGPAWGWLTCLALVSTVGAIGLFLAGLRRVGPVNAAILSTLEPVATVGLAAMVLGETLRATQIAGGVLLLAAAAALQLPPRGPRRLMIAPPRRTSTTTHAADRRRPKELVR